MVFGLYSIAAGLRSAARVAEATGHGRRIFAIEKVLHLDVEPALNRWLLPHDVLRTVANYEYASTYLIAAAAMLVWAYVRRPEQYRAIRGSFVVLNLLGIACFLVYPVAPPRLVPGLPFVDTVRVGHTWGSWGSPLVSHADQLAAMPSLHLAWALWVSVVLAWVTRSRWMQAASALHVLGTLLVIMATANHYLLDAAGGAVAVLLATRRARPGTVPAADAFFLHVESPVAAQHVGGLAVLDNAAGRFGQDSLRRTVQAHLADLPRFRQKLSGGTRWRRPRWVDAPSMDWDWHVPLRDLTRPDGTPGDDAALDALVAALAAEPLSRDRPLWRFVAVVGLDGDRAAAILVVHHVIADGIGTVAQAMEMLEPHLDLPLPPHRKGPGPVRRAFGTAVGLAQLATDGRPSFRLPTGNAPARAFTTVDLPLDPVREVAHRHGTRVSDVLLTTVAGALRRTGAVARGPRAPLLRVAVPLMVRAPGAAAEGNLTAAVMTDLPLGPLAEEQRLIEIARRSRSLYTGTRMLASNFVMRRVGVLPVPVHAWFARTVYGGRFFQAIVSNMPGPSGRLSLAGGVLIGVYPILPLAPRAPLAVGALGWDGVLSIGVAADPGLAPDVHAFGAAMAEVFADLLAATDQVAPVPVAPVPVGQAPVPVSPAPAGRGVGRRVGRRIPGQRGAGEVRPDPVEPVARQGGLGRPSLG